MGLQSYKDLKVWQRSIELIKAVYSVTRKLPESERYGLTSQVQRAAVSIASNIAEGYARSGTGEYLQFLSMAYGSASEVETQLIIIHQQYPKIVIELAESLNHEVLKMLFVLMQKIRSIS